VQSEEDGEGDKNAKEDSPSPLLPFFASFTSTVAGRSFRLPYHTLSTATTAPEVYSGENAL
jgi:hypothetical protein